MCSSETPTNRGDDNSGHGGIPKGGNVNSWYKDCRPGLSGVPRIICIDELDKMPRTFQNQLLNFMESGGIKVDQMRRQDKYYVYETWT
ncbi:MAG: hypothetical protein WBZ36_29465 [Candidatus Nitrosopolaris sp.]